MVQERDPNTSAALNGLMAALVGGNPAMQNQMSRSGQSLDDLLNYMSAGPNQPSATRGTGLADLFGSAAAKETREPGGGSDILGSLLSGMFAGGGASMGEAPSQPAPAGGDDMLGSLFGSMLGAGGASTQPPNQGAGGDMLGSLLGGMFGGGGVPAQGGMPMPPQSPGGGDLIGSLLGGLLGVNLGSGIGGVANNPIANAFVAPISDALGRKLGLPQGIAQVVVVFALTKLLSSATGQSQGRFDPGDLVNKLSTGGTITPKYLKDSGLVGELAEQSGLDAKTASKSLQQTFAALGTHMGDGSMEDKQVELQNLLKTWS